MPLTSETAVRALKLTRTSLSISATTLADRLDVDFALINRNRSKGDAADAEGKMQILVGDVKGKVSAALSPAFLGHPWLTVTA